MRLFFYLTHHTAVCPQQQSGDVRRIRHQVCGGFKEASAQHISLMAFSKRFKIHFQTLMDASAVQRQDWQTLQFMQLFVLNLIKSVVSHFPQKHFRYLITRCHSVSADLTWMGTTQ